MRPRGISHHAALVLVTHHVEEITPAFTHTLLLRAGRVVAAGPSADVLTADAIGALYGVDVDVRFHDRAGHLVVTPFSRARP